LFQVQCGGIAICSRSF